MARKPSRSCHNFAEAWTWEKLLLTIRTIMPKEHPYLVACDFNGTAWRQSNGNNPQPTSILEEAFADTDFPQTTRSHIVAGHRYNTGLLCQMGGTSAWCFLNSSLDFGFRPKDQSCCLQVLLHLDLVGKQYDRESGGEYQHRMLKERSCPYPHIKVNDRYDDEGDHSLSSLTSVRELVHP